MGWALKSIHVRRTRYTEKQKDYMTNKFRIGETTGQKAYAASAAKSMMTARDSNENHLSESSEFLTGQKVSSFFSRLASRRKLSENDEMTESDIKENQNVMDEEAFSEVRSEIFQEVALSHPICYDSYNICKLIADSKLSKFAIQMLQNTCEHFDIPITDIKVKKKAPCIERLIPFSKKCSVRENFNSRFVKTISVMGQNIWWSERLPYEGQPINIGIRVQCFTAKVS